MKLFKGKYQYFKFNLTILRLKILLHTFQRLNSQVSCKKAYFARYAYSRMQIVRNINCYNKIQNAMHMRTHFKYLTMHALNIKAKIANLAKTAVVCAFAYIIILYI